MDDSTYCVMCCTDFSPNALKAFQHAIASASARKNARLCLVHVLPEPDAHFWKTYIYQADFNIDDKAHQDIQKRIDQEYRPLLPPGMAFETIFKTGRDYEQILKCANEITPDLLVIGRQGSGSSSFRSFFFGNVAERVVAQSPCPVLVVPAEKKP